MQRINRISASVAVIAVIATACATVSVFHPWQVQRSHFVLLSAMLVALVLATDLVGSVELPSSVFKANISTSSAVCFGTAIILGPLGGLIAGLAELAAEIFRRNPVLKVAFNVSNFTLTTFGTGVVYFALANTHVSPIANQRNLLATAAAVIVFNLINSGLGSFMFAQVANTSIRQMWTMVIRDNAFTILTLPLLGILVPILAQQQPLAILLMAIPLVGPYLSLRSYSQIHLETRHTLERLANLIDQRDPSTARHSRRVTEYVERIIGEMGELSYEEREAILIAAPVHDIGKIGTSDLVLQKPGKLTHEERDHINQHAADGGDILQNLSLYREAAIIVRHHHERWDGAGYPDRLAAESIPVGSRVIAVADTFDAMTTDRPYRAGLSVDQALDEVQRCAGTQFDPRIAEIFLRVMAHRRRAIELPLITAMAGN